MEVKHFPMWVAVFLTGFVCAAEPEIKLEKVRDTGIENTIIVISLHLYDDYDALNRDHAELHEDHTKVEGWSNCELQPEQNVAFCDVYILRPEYVDDNAMDTLGHEVWHGVAGDFHR